MNTLDAELTWPPEFTLKKHPRARHVKLKASSKNGLELVVPRRFNVKEIPEILELHKPWIIKQLLKLQEERVNSDVLPKEIIFPAIQQTWRVEYIPSNTKLKIIARPHQALVLFGKIDDKIVCKKLLTQWIKKHARIYLAEYLHSISEKINLPYENVSIRDQTTRWGSCSASKSISLNYKLLFLSAKLAAHVIIHELCHTVHLNHSLRFWRLVESFDANWRINRRDLRQAGKLIPAWLA